MLVGSFDGNYLLQNSTIVNYELCPPFQRVRRFKHFSETYWTYHDRKIEAVYVTYGAIIKTLKI